MIIVTNGKEEKAEAVMHEISKKQLKTNSTSYSSMIEGFLKNADVKQGIGILFYNNNNINNY